MLSVKQHSVAYGQSSIIQDLNLEVGKQEIVAVVGRNGMGKTTLMKSLVGMTPSRGGQVTLDGTDLSNLKSFQRVRAGIGFVPQGRMIFPTLTVKENIETGLAAVGEKRIPEDLYELFPVLKEMQHRRGGNLSGGQQQQLAIARALATRPKVLLLDEPLSNLDARLRLEMRTELQRVQRESGVTMVFVTHDQNEALALADRIVVMKEGVIEQIGSPEDVYNRPQSRFVADFVGFENIFPVENGQIVTENGRLELSGAASVNAPGLAWRPNMVSLGNGRFEGEVLGAAFAGGSREYLLMSPLGPIKAEMDAAAPVFEPGSKVAFDLPPERAAVLERM